MLKFSQIHFREKKERILILNCVYSSSCSFIWCNNYKIWIMWFNFDLIMPLLLHGRLTLLLHNHLRDRLMLLLQHHLCYRFILLLLHHMCDRFVLLLPRHTCTDSLCSFCTACVTYRCFCFYIAYKTDWCWCCYWKGRVMNGAQKILLQILRCVH